MDHIILEQAGMTVSRRVKLETIFFSIIGILRILQVFVGPLRLLTDRSDYSPFKKSHLRTMAYYMGHII